MKRRHVVMSLVVIGLFVTPVSAQTGPFVEVSGDLSPVTIAGTDVMWQVAHLAGGVQRPGRFGWMGSVDRHQRGASFDVSFGGNGYRRMGAWTIFGAGAVVDNPSFLYRVSLEGELSRRLVGTLVGHAGYRHLEFRNTTVRIIQPALSWYFARGVVEARGYLVRNLTRATDNQSLLLRGSVDATSRVRLMTGFARGARIFDISTLPNTNGDAWVAFGSVALQVTPQWSMALGVGGAHEDPFFSQRTLSLRLRRSF